MYSANRLHILWPAVEIAMNARQELNMRIAALARQREEGDPIVDSWAADGIIVFGKSMLGMRKVP